VEADDQTNRVSFDLLPDEAEFLTDYWSQTMVAKKPDRKKVTRGCPTLVSRSLEGAVQVPAPSPEEPWRNKRKGNSQGQRRK